MKFYGTNQIKNKDDLFKAIKQIHIGCHQLIKYAFGKYFNVSGNMGVFCHSDDEYELLTKVREDLTEPSDNINQKYYKLIDPIIIAEINTIPETSYTYLYVRKPDSTPYGKYIGDVDFVLESKEYERLKEKVILGEFGKGVQMYDRPGWDTIQISDPAMEAVAYLSTQQMAEKARVKI